MKKKIIPIICTIVALVIIVFSIWYLNKPTRTNENGEITIILLNKDKSEIESKKIEILEGDTFLELLEENFEIVVENGMILKINSLEAYNTKEEFIKIYIDCKPSNKGVKLILPENGVTYRFIIEETSISGNLTNEFC